MTDTTRPVESLSAEAIDAKPIEIDWSEHREDEEPHYFAEAFTYDTDDGTDVMLIAEGPSTTHVVSDGQAWNLSDWDEYRTTIIEERNLPDDEDLPPGTFTEADFEALPEVEPYTQGAEGPMMDYWYPVPLGDTVRAAMRIADLPLCVVTVNDTTGLALTGGGMDLSWEICEAYIRLGFLPPTHFTLPRMAMPLTQRNTYIIEAMRRSLTVQKRWLDGRLDDLDHTATFLAQYRR